MMTNDARETAPARRRQAVRLTMVAGSALTLAISWLGVVQADHAQGPVSVPQPVATAMVAGAGSAVPATGETTLVPAPAATRQVVVVRRSRAS